MNRTLLVVTIVTTTVLVAVFDFWTSAELVGSILFSFPLALCALQRSKRVLWGTATAAVFLTAAAEFWGFHRVAIQNLLVPSVNRGILVASLLTIALLIHFWIEKNQTIVLNAAEIEGQSARLATQNVELERLVTTATLDISIRKETEMHLAQMEGRYRGVLETAPDAMVVVNEQGSIVLVNKQAEKLFGYGGQEVLDQTIEILVPKSFREKHASLRTGFLAVPRVRPMEASLELFGLRKDGTVLPADISLSPLESPDGVLVTATIRDITERKRSETRFLESEERFRVLVEGVQDYSIFTLDPGGKVVSWNAGAERIKGYKAEEIIGQNFSRFYL